MLAKLAAEMEVVLELKLRLQRKFSVNDCKLSINPADMSCVQKISVWHITIIN